MELIQMSVLRNRALLVLGAAEIVNNLGSWITAMALAAILIFQRHGSIAQSTGIFLVGLAPMLLLSPLAGRLCDRVDRRKVMVISRLLEGAFTAGLIFADSLPLIYGLLLLAAICSTVITPARSTILPDVVPPEQLTQANAFLQQTTGIVKVLAPMAAGAVLAVLPPHTAILIDVISFCLSAAVLLLLPPLPPRGRQAAALEQAGSRVSVLSILRDVPGLSILLPLSFLIMLVMIAFDVSASVYVRDVLHGSVSFTGIIVGVIGAGTIGGSSLLMLRKGPHNAWRDIITGLLLLAVVPGALAAAAPGPAPAVGRPLVVEASPHSGASANDPSPRLRKALFSSTSSPFGRCGNRFWAIMPLTTYRSR
jgi:MFS family permease